MLGLDAENLEAIETTDCPLFVIADSGSGRAKTLVERTIHLTQQGETATTISVATFTEKAVSELVPRIPDRLLELNLRVNLISEMNAKECLLAS